MPFLWRLPGHQSGPYISCPVSGARVQSRQGPVSVCRKSHTMTGRLSSTRLRPPHSGGSPPPLSRAAAVQNGRHHDWHADLHLRLAAPTFISLVCFNEAPCWMMCCTLASLEGPWHACQVAWTEACGRVFFTVRGAEVIQSNELLCGGRWCLHVDRGRTL